MYKLINILGIFVILGIAFLLSNNKKKVNLRLVGTGLFLQFILAATILWTTPGQHFFEAARFLIAQFLSSSDVGAKFIFGENFKEHFFAFSVLPTIIFVSSFTAVRFHLGIIQKVVKVMAKIMIKFMSVSGAESLAASANVFVGQTEAPLLIKPYLKTMTKSELMAMMTGGMATISGGVMAAYASMGADPGHLLAASLMAAPGSLILAKIMYPETEESVTKGVVKIELPSEDANVLDAACRGASDGLKLALNVAAMLIAFISIVYLMDMLLGIFPDIGGAPLTFSRILGYLFYPLAWIIGIEANDVMQIAQLLGKKIMMNEFIAYVDLIKIKESISPRSFIITTYALCGFANLSSVAIQIGGIGSLEPGRRADFAKIGLKAMIAGALAALLNATIAGLMIA